MSSPSPFVSPSLYPPPSSPSFKVNLPLLRETIFEKKYGFHDYKWRVSMALPPTTPISVRLIVPEQEVWLERGYSIDVSKLNVIQMDHWHDGKPQFSLMVDEMALELPYTKLEVLENFCDILLYNNDTAPVDITVIGHYRSIPRSIYKQIYNEV